jgi:ribokinase
MRPSRRRSPSLGSSAGNGPEAVAGSPRIAVVGHVEWVTFLSVACFPQEGAVVHSERAFEQAAGGGAVVARVLAHQGAQVDFFCALGRDRLGELAAAALGGRGLHLHIAWRKQPTRQAITLIDGSLGERTIITVGPRLEVRGGDELPWERLEEAAAVYFTAGDSVALARARRAPVLVVSPRAERALSAANRKRQPAIDALIYSATDRYERELAERLGSRARLLVATDGARGGSWRLQAPGLAARERQGRWRASWPPAQVRDSYGAGDSFAAGLTLGLARKQKVEQALALGARLGALALTRRGAP